uniref:Phosphodiesterase n=1 Tax=Ditylenchus dipsaci TaxID=166011 RepID=A0A915E7J1_9BILA
MSSPKSRPQKLSNKLPVSPSPSAALANGLAQFPSTSSTSTHLTTQKQFQRRSFKSRRDSSSSYSSSSGDKSPPSPRSYQKSAGVKFSATVMSKLRERRTQKLALQPPPLLPLLQSYHMGNNLNLCIAGKPPSRRSSAVVDHKNGATDVLGSVPGPTSYLNRSQSMICRQGQTSMASVELIVDLRNRKHACRLRYILHQLNSGQLPLEDLKRNIEYAALVLETAYMDETRRICDEDDDLAEVTPDTVPDEVREWLAATFTRQTAQTKREKPKFKSVANAIRTGIFFEKIFRRTQTVLAPIPPEYSAYLRQVSTWNFNSFELNENTDGHALKYVGFELFNRYGFLERFKINYQILENYLLALEAGYSRHNNPYHNTVYAADVTQTSHFMLSQTGLASSLSDLEMLAVIFGALIHDYEHTGHTNNFHIQSGSQFAMLYNDRSVLENHHVSSCFRMMKEDEKNMFERLTRDEFRELRNMVIEIVLATDMSTHFVQIKTMKNMLSLPEGIDKMKALCLIVHACDISHASKSWDLHSRWTEGVLEEFFRQGDLEASMGLPYSPLCDRHTVHVAESQIGFIDFIVEPTMNVCGEMLTKLVEPLVSLPSSDSLFPPNSNMDGSAMDGSVSNASLSPVPDLKSPNGNNSVRKVPINYFGKLEIPNPWVRHLQENKSNWREKAVKEEAERNNNIAN